jgi:hypothetical protein
MFCDVFITFLIFENYVNVAYKGTVKSGNFVTFFAQNIFFSQNFMKLTHIFFLVGNS